MSTLSQATPPRGQDSRPIRVGDTVRRVPVFSRTLGVEVPAVVGVVTAIRTDGLIDFRDVGIHTAPPELLRRSRARVA